MIKVRVRVRFGKIQKFGFGRSLPFGPLVNMVKRLPHFKKLLWDECLLTNLPQGLQKSFLLRAEVDQSFRKDSYLKVAVLVWHTNVGKLHNIAKKKTETVTLYSKR